MKTEVRRWATVASIAVTFGIVLGTWVPSAQADVVVIQSRPEATACNYAWYSDLSFSNTSGLSNVSGLCTQSVGRYAYSGTPSFTVKPILGTAGGVYRVSICKTYQNSNMSQDIVCAITQVRCTGLLPTTTAFQRQYGGSTAATNVWVDVGTITLDAGANNPEITFTYQSGTLAGTGGRFIIYGVRFADACADVPGVTVSGPLVAGGNQVEIRGVATTATAVVVYANGVEIGRKTVSASTGTELIPIDPPLIKGQYIQATQIVNGIEGCKPPANSGPVVGGGPNPRIRVVLSIRQNTALTGPIGANAGVPPLNSKLVYLGSGGINGGFGMAPSGGKVLQPGGCWQTVSFLRGADPANPVDPTYAWAGSDGSNNLEGNFGALDSIAFAIDDLTDTGDYKIYIDNFENGAVRIVDWEGFAADTVEVEFQRPLTSGSTAGMLLMAPDVSKVVDTTADSGTNSCLVNWQWNSVANTNWLRLLAFNDPKPYPMVDLRKPISFRMLVLPVGGTASAKPTITAEPTDAVNVCPGQLASFTVTATGTNLLSYQWMKSADDGTTWTDLPDQTTATANITAASDESQIWYRCRIIDTVTNCDVFTVAVRIIPTAVSITAQPVSAYVCADETAQFSVTATSTAAGDLTYQWFEDGSQLTDGAGISGATTATLTVAPDRANRNGRIYSVTVSNTCTPPQTITAGAKLNLIAPPDPATISVSPTTYAYGNTVTLTGLGLFLGQYFNGGGSSPAFPLDGAPVLTRLDPIINFEWGTGTPAPGVGNAQGNLFMVRWQARLRAPVTGNYTFYCKTDDGARLWVNGTLTVEHWPPQPPTEWCGTTGATAPGTCNIVSLTAGDLVDLRMDYYENTGGAHAELSWEAVDGAGYPNLSKRHVGMGQWKHDGVVVGEGSEYVISSLKPSDTGWYEYSTVDPCTGEPITASNQILVYAPNGVDFNSDGKVDSTDMGMFIGCYAAKPQGPDIPFESVAPIVPPCKAAMDIDGDGDMDQDDFGLLQVQYNPAP